MKRKNISFFFCFFLIVVSGFSWRNLFMDDAFIGFRCISNFLSGSGFIFNPAMQVESVTNIGWLLALAPFSKFLPVELAGKLVGALFLFLSAWILCFAASRLDENIHESSGDKKSFFVFFIPVIVFTNSAVLYFSHSGMETAFTLFFTCLPFCLNGGHYRSVKIAVIYFLAYLIRPECLLLFPFFLLGSIILGCNTDYKVGKEQLVRAFGVWCVGIILITLGRYMYFGAFLPNTFYAKPSSLLDLGIHVYKFLLGISLNLPAPFSGVLFLVIAFLGFKNLKTSSEKFFPVCFAGFFTGFVFCLYSSNDWTLSPRYLAPYLPFFAIVLFSGLQELKERLFKDKKNLVLVFSIILFFFLIFDNTVNMVKWFGASARELYPGYVIACESLIEPSKDITSIVPADSIIAVRRIGIFGFISKLELFDYTFGLPDREVVLARKKVGGRIFDNPKDEGLRDLWLKRRPDYFLEDRSRIVKFFGKHNSANAAFKIHGLQYREIKSYKIGKDEEWVLCALILD